MAARLLVWIGIAGMLLGACGGAPTPTQNARIVAFTTSGARAPRGEPVTLSWQAADAGVQDGLFSCLVTRRVGDDPTATTLQATCAGSMLDVPPAPLTADAVHYRFEVLKDPYQADDPYLANEHTVTLDAAKYAVGAGGTDVDNAWGVSTLPDGGAVVTGTFDGTATFGTTTLTSAGFNDVFVARIDPNGTWSWATRAGGTLGDFGADVSALPDGGAVVTGTFGGTATFGTTTLTSAGALDVFVARIDPNGTWTWATRAGGTLEDFGADVSALPDGGAIVTGDFSGTATFGTEILFGDGQRDVFVARIRPDGTWAWATRAGGSSNDTGTSVSTLPDGGAIVTGYFSGVAFFGAAEQLVASGGADAFVARIDSDGTWTWATRAGGTLDDIGDGVRALPDGGAIVTGYFADTATFGSTTLTSAGSIDAFVARIDPDGTWTWATRAGGTLGDYGGGVSALPDGGAIVTGFFEGTATFGTTTLISIGVDDVFVARIDPIGTWTWATRAGGTLGDSGADVSALPDGGAIVTGTFRGTATFGTTALTSAGDKDLFVARIDTSGAW